MVALGILCLGVGLLTGLSRIGWNISLPPAAAHHGAIMVGGFLGTLIALGKIIPLKRKWLYVVPALNVSSVALILCNLHQIAIGALIASSFFLSVIFLYYFRSYKRIIYILMFAGALCWMMGNVLLLTRSFYPLAFPWWSAFALFIIVAERLELLQFTCVTRFEKYLLTGMLCVFLVGVSFSFHGAGSILCGVSLIGISIWLLKNDLIGINITKSGVRKYIAITLMESYTALLLTGIFFLILSDNWLTYDAIVHSFFIGFVFSMIFAHGPLLLAAIIGLSINPYHRIMYVWPALLHTSWLIRVFADVNTNFAIRKISGILTVITIIGFFVTLATVTAKQRRHDIVS